MNRIVVTFTILTWLYGLYILLFHIKLCSGKANHITDIALTSVRNYFSCCEIWGFHGDEN